MFNIEKYDNNALCEQQKVFDKIKELVDGAS
jgi:hypothetical protein